MNDFAKAFLSIADAKKPHNEKKFEFGAEDKIREAYDFGVFVGLISKSTTFDEFVETNEAMIDFGVENLKEHGLSGEELDELLRLILLEFAENNNCAVREEVALEGREVVEELGFFEPKLSQFKVEDPYQELVEVVDQINHYLTSSGSEKVFYIDQTDPDVFWIMYLEKKEKKLHCWLSLFQFSQLTSLFCIVGKCPAFLTTPL